MTKTLILICQTSFKSDHSFENIKFNWQQSSKQKPPNGIPSYKIFVTKDLENTPYEAVSVKELISQSKRIILVTSAYHMYRAKKLFEKQGLEVIPYKVDYRTARKSAINVLDFLPSAGNLELSETGIREIIGRLYYSIRS